jgi:hypothetical protein
MGTRHAFTTERGQPMRIIDGDPEARFYLEEKIGADWVTLIFQHTTTQMAVGALCRETIRLANPGDPSL